MTSHSVKMNLTKRRREILFPLLCFEFFPPSPLSLMVVFSSEIKDTVIENIDNIENITKIIMFVCVRCVYHVYQLK